MKPLFSKISFLNLYSDDPQKLIQFYRDKLGMSPEPQVKEGDDWYGFQTEGLTFAIEPSSNRENYKDLGVNLKNNVLIQFHADSLEELEAMNKQLEKNGVKLLNKSKHMSYGVITNFVDPDGNLMEILYPVDEKTD